MGNHEGSKPEQTQFEEEYRMNEKIQIDEVKRHIQCCIDTDNCILCSFFKVGCDKSTFGKLMLNAVKQLEAQVQKWISVEERLPEPETEALVWCGKFVCTAHYGYVRGGGCIFWDYDCEGFEDELYPPVTHWMPLPEPPKEG